MSMIDLQIQIGYDLIIDEIPTGSKILDLGCGDGLLLEKLCETRQITPFGVEISADGVSQCVERGLYCYQGDIDEGLSDYREYSFDYVILNQTLQITKRPSYVLQEMMRISKNAIVSFPNFAYQSTRLHLLLKGTMPKNLLLPFEWYETPNIHLLTIRDFQHFCAEKGFPVKKERHFSLTGTGMSKPIRIMPNIRAQYGFFVLDGDRYSVSASRMLSESS